MTDTSVLTETLGTATSSDNGNAESEVEAKSRANRNHIFIEVPEALKDAALVAAKASDLPISGWARKTLADALGYKLEFNTGSGLATERAVSDPSMTDEERKAKAKARRELFVKIMAAVAEGKIDLSALGVSIYE